MSNAPPGEADRLAQALVEEGLAACVNLSPVRSVFRWNGAVQQEPEVAMWIKVSAAALPVLRERLLELHSYDVPELLVLPVDTEASSEAYVRWVREVSGA